MQLGLLDLHRRKGYPGLQVVILIDILHGFPHLDAVVMGLVNDDEEKIRSETEVVIGGIRGRKVNFYRDFGEIYLEMDVYILPKEETLYMVMFGEKDYISPEMKKCEQTIIDSFIFE